MIFILFSVFGPFICPNFSRKARRISYTGERAARREEQENSRYISYLHLRPLSFFARPLFNLLKFPPAGDKTVVSRSRKKERRESENIPNDYRSQYDRTIRFYLLIDHRIIFFFHTSYVSLGLSLYGMHLRVAFRFLAWPRTGAVLYFLPLETEAFFSSSSFFFFLRFSYSSLSPTSYRSFFRTNVKSRTGGTTTASCVEPDPDS